MRKIQRFLSHGLGQKLMPVVPSPAKRFLFAFPVFLFALLSFSSPTFSLTESRPFPPARIENVVETIHGEKVADPYRWLESLTSDEVKAWVEAQNSYTRSFLDSVPFREKIEKRLEELFSIGSLSVPRPRGSYYFFTKREAKENQPILHVRKGLTGKPSVLVDPNGLSKEGVVALDWWYPSEDGEFVAYGLSKEGSEQSTLYIKEVKTGKTLSDTIPRTRGSSVAWVPDGKSFYYTRFPNPGDVPRGEEYFHRKVFYHVIGTDPKDDALIFGEGRDMKDWYVVGLTPDGKYLLVTVEQGPSRSEIYFKDLRSTTGFIPIAEGVDAIFEGKVFEDCLYLMTNENAPKFKMMTVDLTNPARQNWVEIVPESKGTLEWFSIIGKKLFLGYLENAFSRLKVFSLEGKEIHEIEFPVPGSIQPPSGESHGTEAFIGFQSYFVPATIYRYDIPANSLKLYDRVEASIDASQYKLDQVFFPSKDGTRVSMFLVHKKNLTLNGENPVILNGYGGFNVSITPGFAKNMLFWIENGGVFAVVNLRGGGEYGEDWHRAGMLGNKQNVFDDFISAAEWLIKNEYTTPSKLVSLGGSNGGLLVAATLTQRPELFRASVSLVPVIDMTRYHLFSVGRYWLREYGSPENPEDFKWLYAYSPYHRVREGEKYPAVLITTAEADSRVDPMHAKKMAARLQKATSSGKPILLRYETKAGHGIGTPLSKSIDLYTDIYCFLFWQLDLKPPSP